MCDVQRILIFFDPPPTSQSAEGLAFVCIFAALLISLSPLCGCHTLYVESLNGTCSSSSSPLNISTATFIFIKYISCNITHATL